MENIKGYDFIDCLLVDFNVNQTCSELHIIVEAFYPIRNEQKRKKGLIKIIFKQIKTITIEKKREFDLDLKIPYDKSGNDMKSNEIYSITSEEISKEVLACNLKSDMLNLSIKCDVLSIEELAM